MRIMVFILTKEILRNIFYELSLCYGMSIELLIAESDNFSLAFCYRNDSEVFG